MKAAESLKLYRRADLQDPEKGTDLGTDLIEKLYVDPVPHDQVLQTVMRSNTTFLIGRGTSSAGNNPLRRGPYSRRPVKELSTDLFMLLTGIAELRWGSLRGSSLFLTFLL